MNDMGLSGLPITDAIVSYVKATPTGATSQPDIAGFFLQNDPTGPAIYVAIDPATVAGGVQVGDVLDVTATTGEWTSCNGTCTADNSLYAISAGTFTRTGTAAPPAAQDLSADPQFQTAIDPALFGAQGWDVESELVTMTGTLTSAAQNGGLGYTKWSFDTAGTAGTTALSLRLTNDITPALNLYPGCSLTVTGTPMFRYGNSAELSAWKSSEISGVSCPAPTVLSTSPTDGATAVDVGSAISVTFSAPMDPSTIVAQAVPGACDPNAQVLVSTDGFATCIGLSAPVASAGNTTFTFTPTPGLSYGSTYKVRVLVGAKSVRGDLLASEYDQTNGFTTVTPGSTCDGSLVISAVYGGGGNSGAVFNADYVELYNRGTTPVSLSGLSLQYASGTSNTWAVKATLPVATVQPGHYYLVEDSPGANGVALPAADFTAPLALGASSGKVALVSGTASVANCGDANVLDLVGYGSATCADTTPVGTSTLSSSKAAERSDNGCLDSNAASDFTAVTLTTSTPPRNSASATNSCSTTDCPLVSTLNESGNALEADYCKLLGVSGTVVTGELYEASMTTGVTQCSSLPSGIQVQVGYGPLTSNPETDGTNWGGLDATCTSVAGNNAEYSADLSAATPPPTAGQTYFVGLRVSLDNGSTWTYCDENGAGSNPGLQFEITQLPQQTF